MFGVHAAYIDHESLVSIDVDGLLYVTSPVFGLPIGLPIDKPKAGYRRVLTGHFNEAYSFIER